MRSGCVLRVCAHWPESGISELATRASWNTKASQTAKAARPIYECPNANKTVTLVPDPPSSAAPIEERHSQETHDEPQLRPYRLQHAAAGLGHRLRPAAAFPADQPDRSQSSRRRGRHRGPRDRPAARPAAQAYGHRRQPPRRQRQHRLPGRGPLGAGRLHPAGVVLRLPHGQSLADDQAAMGAEGLHAGRPAGGRHQRDRGPPFAAGQHAPRADRLPEEEPRQGDLRVPGQRLAVAHRHRTLQAADRHRHAARAV